MKQPQARVAAAAMLLALAAGPFAGCLVGPSEPSSLRAGAAPMPQPDSTHPLPSPGESRRIGGDATAAITGSNGDYRSGASRIDTPLPDGYPAPTPPGSIDLKTYPSVRLAEVAATGNPDRGMNRAFWALFNHIKRNDIAMTSPVELTFDEPRAARTSGTPWSMAFLYRTPDLRDTGSEGRVTIRNSRPMTVVAAGLRGNYSMSLVQQGMEQVEDWLAQNPGWEPDGRWRVLYYNGPALAWWNKWAEVQLPVRPAQHQP